MRDKNIRLHPFMRSLSRSTMDAILALTIGLLAFLGIETAKQGLEVAARVPDPSSGHVLFTTGVLMVYFLIQIVGFRGGPDCSEAARRFMISYLLALGMGCTTWPRALRLAPRMPSAGQRWARF